MIREKQLLHGAQAPGLSTGGSAAIHTLAWEEATSLLTCFVPSMHLLLFFNSTWHIIRFYYKLRNTARKF